jgi:TP901 family phage tail tape measure protein
MASNQLNFSVWLRDKTSAGMASVTNRFRTLQRMGRQTQQSWSSIGIGTAGVWAVGRTLQGLTGSAREMNAARGELHSLLDGWGSQTLDKVQSEAMTFANNYGKSASEFVRASYDIQSAIGGLNGAELARFTKASATLAVATKADTATITSYMGAMYGIFETQATRIGKSKWVEQIAGQTALAVQKYRTDGNQLSAAFEGVGARASNQGISQGEQFAILGSASKSMKGANVGTAYGSYMDALPKAQKRLGLSFSDSEGRALSMIGVIDKLKSKFGDTLSLTEKGKINSAFGSVGAKLIDALWNKTGTLRADIAQFNNITTLSQALIMAEKITDSWDKLGQSVNNTRILFGQSLVTAVEPFVTYLTDSFVTLQKWIVMFPHLTTAITYFTMGIIALGTAAAIGMLAMGAWRVGAFGFKIILTVLRLALWDAAKGVYGLIASFAKLVIASWQAIAAKKALILNTYRLSMAYLSTLKANLITFFIRMKNGIVAAAIATKTLTLATLASGRASIIAFGSRILAGISTMASLLRTTLIVARALTLVTLANGRASLFAFGGQIIGAIASMTTGIGKLLIGFVSLIPTVWSLAVAFIAAIGWVPLLIAGIVIGVGILIAKWDVFIAAFSDTSWFMGIQAALGSFVGYLNSIGDWFNSTWSSITGFFKSNTLNASIEQQANIINKSLPLSYHQASNTQPTTIPSRYSSQTIQNQTTTHSVGAINVNTTNAPGRAEMNAYMAMVAP